MTTVVSVQIIRPADNPILPGNEAAGADGHVGELERLDDLLRLVGPDVHMAAVEGGYSRSSARVADRKKLEERRTEDPWLGRVEVDALDSLGGCQHVKRAEGRRDLGRDTSERAKSWRCTWRDMLATGTSRGGRAGVCAGISEQRGAKLEMRFWLAVGVCPWACGQVARNQAARHTAETSRGRCATCLHVQPHIGRLLSRGRGLDATAVELRELWRGGLARGAVGR